MSAKMRVALTHSEQEQSGSVVAYEFSARNGGVAIRECWSDHDEVYSDGLTIVIPHRVWAVALPWLAEHLPSPSLLVGGEE
jgi:hypothetical protein